MKSKSSKTSVPSPFGAVHEQPTPHEQGLHYPVDVVQFKIFCQHYRTGTLSTQTASKLFLNCIPTLFRNADSVAPSSSDSSIHKRIYDSLYTHSVWSQIGFDEKLILLKLFCQNSFHQHYCSINDPSFIESYSLHHQSKLDLLDSMTPSEKLKAAAWLVEHLPNSMDSNILVQSLYISRPSFMGPILQAATQPDHENRTRYGFCSWNTLISPLDIGLTCTLYAPQYLSRISLNTSIGSSEAPRWSLLLGQRENFEAYLPFYKAALLAPLPNPTGAFSIKHRLLTGLYANAVTGTTSAQNITSFVQVLTDIQKDPVIASILTGRKSQSGTFKNKPFYRHILDWLDFSSTSQITRLVALIPALIFSLQFDEQSHRHLGQWLSQKSKHFSDDPALLSLQMQPYSHLFSYLFKQGLKLNDIYKYTPTTEFTILDQLRDTLNKIKCPPVKTFLQAQFESECLQLGIASHTEALSNNLDIKAFDPARLAEFTKLLSLFGTDATIEFDKIIQSLKEHPTIVPLLAKNSAGFKPHRPPKSRL